MTHSQLVQAATDLISEVGFADQWIAEYDAALTSSSDRQLIQFIARIGSSLHLSTRLAA